jgi:hypothetical protein
MKTNDVIIRAEQVEGFDFVQIDVPKLPFSKCGERAQMTTVGSQ